MVEYIQKDCLSAISLQHLQDYADELSELPNFWMKREDIESGTFYNPAEAAVVALFFKSLSNRNLLPDRWAGAEYWVQIYQQGRGLAFHFDKDEHLMKEQGEMSNPLYSSVFYLTGDATKPADQSPTVVTNQQFDHEEGCPVPEDPTSSTLVFPVTNTYCVFGGGLGHGVLDCGSHTRRATLLVNWWDHKPEEINAFDSSNASDVAKKDDDQIKQLTQHLATAAIEADDDKEESAEITRDIKTISISAESTLGSDDLIPVDDVLSQYKISLSGRDAIQAIKIDHEGLALYPLDSEQLSEIPDEHKPLVGAVFACME